MALPGAGETFGLGSSLCFIVIDHDSPHLSSFFSFPASEVEFSNQLHFNLTNVSVYCPSPLFTSSLIPPPSFPFVQTQDTPGYGDFDGPEDAESQRTAVLEHIRACSERYYQQETSPDRGSPLHTVPDIRIDVCLYFLQPHRLRRTDIRFIKELSKLVPVVPVLAKADAMTPEELHQFREAVREKLHRHRHADKWQFSQEALEGAGAGRGPPFAVVAASTVDRSVGRFWPVRRYPWGRAEPLSTAHSELPTLRKLLFETGYWELKAHTDEEYLGFRKKRVAEDASPVPVSCFFSADFIILCT